MKCFYHPDRDVVGTCSQCGKGVCHECVVDVGGALLCKGCKELASAEVAAQEAADREEAIGYARRTIRKSWIVTVLIGGIGAIGPLSAIHGLGPVAILLAIFMVYAVWSWYWGIQGTRDWWHDHITKGREPGWFSVVMFYIAAFYYGLFGGGIREYSKYRRMVGTE